MITWENPATTVFIEMKYGSPLSAKTVNNNGSAGYPADQLIRNARVGLRENGWFTEDVLFDLPPRDFVLILLTPTSGNSLVQEYRNADQLRAAIPHAERLKDLPGSPFIGELSYRNVINILAEQQRWFSLPERRLIGELNEYLQFKLSQLRTSNGHGHG